MNDFTFLKTTTSCLQYSKELITQAKRSSNSAEYSNLLNLMDSVETFINDSIESGYFVGIARDELVQAKQNLVLAKTIVIDRGISANVF